EADIASAGYGPVDIEWLPSAEVRYKGQASQLSIPLGSGLLDADALQRVRAAFEAEHRLTFGYTSPEEGLESVNLRLTARVSRPLDAAGKVGLVENRSAAASARRAYFG